METKNKAELFLIRGIPGSGKSTFARKLMMWIGVCNHIEADMFFVDKDNVYTYDKTRIKEAHDWCFNDTVKMLENGETVIVSNTFTETWQYKRYVEYAGIHKIPYTVLTVNGDHGSVHDVPQETVNRMKQQLADSQ